MSARLTLSKSLALPLDAVTRRLAILAMSGAGKSNVAVVLAEQMFDAGVPWVAIDPKGDWWGIRSSQDGKGPGLPVPIFGGLHGDVPLEPTGGKVIGDLIVDQRLTCVLDISEFGDRQAQWGFLIDLGETLLRRNREALHLFLEEADEYLPQRTSEKGNLPKCLGVWQRVVKRGRFRGIGSTQITQRNASLNKDTLYQAEALIAMRVTGKTDRDAVAGWVEYHNAAADIVKSLPTLADGEAWFTSPAWLRKTERVQFNRRRTFDSGSTPVLLKGKSKPATLADVDLGKLQTAMAATIEKAKADDPKELRKQIADLKAQAAKDRAKYSQTIPAPEKVKEIAVLTDGDRARIEKFHTRLNEIAEVLLEGTRILSERFAAWVHVEAQAAIVGMEGQHENARKRFAALLDQKDFQKILGKLATVQASAPPQMPPQRAERTTPARPSAPPTGTVMPGGPRTPPRPAVSGPAGEDPRLANAKGLKKHVVGILTALAQHPVGLTREQTLILAGYSPSGDISTAFAGLLEQGWIAQAGTLLTITEAGSDALGPVTALPTGAELRAQTLARSSSAERKILDAIFGFYDDGIGAPNRAQIHERAGLRPSGDTSTAFGKFLKLGWIVEQHGGFVPASVFYEEA